MKCYNPFTSKISLSPFPDPRSFFPIFYDLFICLQHGRRVPDIEWGLLGCEYHTLINASEGHVEFSGDSITLLAHINLILGKNACNILTYITIWPGLSFILWFTCFLTLVPDTAFIFIQCHLLRVNLLFQPVKMTLNLDSVILYISHFLDLVVNHRFDNTPSLSSSKSMIKMLTRPCHALGTPPSCEFYVCLNFIQLARNLCNYIKIPCITLFCM
jgi:hypothetical protein